MGSRTGELAEGGQRRRHVRVYLCDDVPEIRRLVRLVLEQDPDKQDPPIEVVGEAGEAVTAIAEVRDLRPDVVLLDLSLPGVDGLEALPQIKEAVPEAVVIVFSGFSAARMAAVALAHGADRYVDKDVELTELRDIVREYRAAA